MNHKSIRLIGLSSITSSNLADGLLVGAIPLLAYQLTNNILYISMMSLVRPLSLLLCGSIIGTILSFFSNKKLLRTSSSFRF